GVEQEVLEPPVEPGGDLLVLREPPADRPNLALDAEAERRFGCRQRRMQILANPGPHVAEIALHVRMLDEVVPQGLTLADQLLVVLERGLQREELLVELNTGRVIRVLGDLVQNPLELAD